MNDYSWPIFKVKQDVTQKKFWNKRTKEDFERIWIEKSVFQGQLLRIGKKKKNPKGYFFNLEKDGILLYFKKEGDSQPKGFLKLDMTMRISLNVQKTKHLKKIPVIYIERVKGIGISVFDHVVDKTFYLFENLKFFTLVRGFDFIYNRIEELGKGSFATVYKIQQKNNSKLYAAKTYFQDVYEENQHKSKFYQMVHNEVEVLKTIAHPKIMKIYEIIQDPDKLVLVLEFIEGGDLYQLVKIRKRIGEHHSAIMLEQISQALLAMHQINYVHRDLKLENIMLTSKDSFDVKLVDFGFAEQINNQELVSKAGTPGFMPPEIYKNQPYTSKGDIFSLGIIFYFILSGSSPFQAKNTAKMHELNRTCDIKFTGTFWDEVSSECKGLLSRMCHPNPEKRISCSEILQSAWIVKECQSDEEGGINYNFEQNPIIIKQVDSEENEQEQKEQEQQEFQGDFSYPMVRSLYQKNSMKSSKRSKMNKSMLKTKHRGRSEVKGEKNKEVKEGIEKKSMSMKASVKIGGMKNSMKGSIKFRQVDDDEINKLKQNQEQNVEEDSFDASSSLRIAQDFSSINIQNQLFLQISDTVFNQPKIPRKFSVNSELLIILQKSNQKNI